MRIAASGISEIGMCVYIGNDSVDSECDITIRPLDILSYVKSGPNKLKNNKWRE